MEKNKAQREKLEEKNLKFIYGVIQKQIEIQISAVDSLDNKTGSIVGFLGTLLAGISLLKPEAFLANFFITSGFLLVFGSVVLSIWALWVKDYQIPPKPRAFHEEQREKGYLETVEQQVSNIVYAYEKNETIIKKKAKLLKCSLATLLLGLIVVILTGLLTGGTFMSKDDVRKPPATTPNGGTPIPPPKPSQIQPVPKAPPVPEPKESQWQTIPLAEPPEGKNLLDR